jgi:hypothetical protein
MPMPTMIGSVLPEQFVNPVIDILKPLTEEPLTISAMLLEVRHDIFSKWKEPPV